MKNIMYMYNKRDVWLYKINGDWEMKVNKGNGREREMNGLEMERNNGESRWSNDESEFRVCAHVETNETSMTWDTYTSTQHTLVTDTS